MPAAIRIEVFEAPPPKHHASAAPLIYAGITGRGRGNMASRRSLKNIELGYE
jgi:hypothetical protein